LRWRRQKLASLQRRNFERSTATAAASAAARASVRTAPISAGANQAERFQKVQAPTPRADARRECEKEEEKQKLRAFIFFLKFLLPLFAFFSPLFIFLSPSQWRWKRRVTSSSTRCGERSVACRAYALSPTLALGRRSRVGARRAAPDDVENAFAPPVRSPRRLDVNPNLIPLLCTQAEQALKKWTLFSGSDKYEDAAEKLQRAGNAYKAAKACASVQRWI
jgi:hypothetical protein